MNELISLVAEKHSYLFLKEFKRPLNELWLKSPTAKKVIWCNDYVDDLDPNTTTVIGGICGTKSTSLKNMEDNHIDTIDKFKKWHLSWYPRIDQIHDSVGIPPRTCKNLIYVFEDNSHADRIINIRKNWDFLEVKEILREAHIKHGQKVLENWLRFHGYQGNISFIFLSELEKEIELGIRIATKFGLKNESKHKQIRKLMYTSIWPSVLGVKKDALIYEPIHYISRHYNKYNSILDEVGILSYLPYLSCNYLLDEIPHNKIANYGNPNLFNNMEEALFDTINLLFSKEKVVSNPKEFSHDYPIVEKLISQDLTQYFKF